MILNSSGQIASWTQYNTLSSCAIDNPTRFLDGTSSFYGFGSCTGFYFMNKPSQEIVCGVIDYMECWTNATSPPIGRGNPTIWWYGPGMLTIGTQCYTKDYQGVFTKKNYTVQGNPGFASKEVYRIDRPEMAYGGWMPFGVQHYYPTTDLVDEWVIISISDEGIVTNIETYNTFSTTCP